MFKILRDRGKEKVCVCAWVHACAHVCVLVNKGGLSEFIIQLLPHVGHMVIIVSLHTHQV